MTHHSSLPLVIVNPVSAGGATRDSWARMASDLRAHFGAFSVAFTEGAGDGRRLAEEAAKQETKLIVACGGDGTISEVANGIVNSGRDAELGILPSGTGGDFRKTVGIPSRSRDAAAILREGQTRQIDVGRVTFIDHDGQQDSRYFLGVASIGLSTKVIERVKAGGPDWLPGQTPRWLSGRVSFGVSMLESALRSEVTRVIVEIDDGPEKHLALTTLCIANARYFGGGMKIAPQAKLADGHLDVISVGDLGPIKILTNAPRIYLGSHLGMQEVGHTLARKIVVRAATEADVALEIDGELLGRLPATFQILPAALRLRCPK